MGGIFVSYRRTDSEDMTGRICERLRATFGSANVFQDTRTIPYGANFREEIATYLGNSSAALIIIGPTWLTASEGRQQRLFQPNDVVRVEVEMALASPRLIVIPVLVGGAHLPAKKELPESLATLRDRSATTIHGDPDFDHDMSDLIDALAKVIPVTGNTGVTRVREFEDRQINFAGLWSGGMKLLLQGPLDKGQFVFVNAGNVWFTIRTVIPWPRPVEAMWQACLAIDSSAQRAVTNKGVGFFAANHRTMDFLFSSANFRVKSNYRFTASMGGLQIKSSGTFIIESREAKTADAVLDAYQKQLTAMKG